MAPVVSSHARVRGIRKGPALFGLLMLLALAVGADASVIVELHDENVAIVATGATLRSVLEALADQRIVDVSASIPLQSTITLSTVPEPLSRLLKRLLRPYSYALIEHDASSGLLPRLHVYAGSDPGAPFSWTARRTAAHGRIDRAIADLASPDADIRQEAVLTLSDTGDPNAITHFFAMLGDPSSDVREAARAAIEDMETMSDRPFANAGRD